MVKKPTKVPEIEANAVKRVTPKEEIKNLEARIDRLEDISANTEDMLKENLADSRFSRDARGIVIFMSYLLLVLLFAFSITIIGDKESFKGLSTAAQVALISGPIVAFISISGFLLVGLFPKPLRKDEDNREQYIPATLIQRILNRFYRGE